MNVNYCYSTISKQDFKYISDDLYSNVYLDVEPDKPDKPDDSDTNSNINKIEKIMKLIILQDNELSFYQRIYSADLFLEY